MRAGAAAAADAGFSRMQRSILPHARRLRRSPGASAMGGEGDAERHSSISRTTLPADDIRLACREGYRHIEHAKRYTTHTMGTEQGKTGGLVGAAVLAEARGEHVQRRGSADVPTVHHARWPGAPSPVPACGPRIRAAAADPDARLARAARRRVHGCRRSGCARAAIRSRQRCRRLGHVLREARAVRRAVGICDVSTLGKIDVQGRDAGRCSWIGIYANTFSTLPVGRARYGLMLREDGIVFDDGTTSRLGPDHFFVTTTTANAGPVLAHLEFHLQTCWPELDVQIASVTDQFASMSIAGPRARDVVRAVAQGLDLANEAFPFMAVGDARGRRLSRARVPHQFFRRAGLRDRHALGLWPACVGRGDAGGRAVRNRALRHGGAGTAADRERPRRRTGAEWTDDGRRSRPGAHAEEARRLHRPRAAGSGRG